MMYGQQLANPKRQTWVKAALGFQCLKEGLEPFCDDIVKQQHADIVNRVKQQHNLTTLRCGQCNLRTLQPNHVRSGNRQCPLGQQNCNCQYPSGKMACPNNTCGAIYDEIIRLHASTPPSPYWKNTDVKLWCSQPWAIAKCFINASGYSQILTASEIDCSGLLHILIKNKGLRKHINCNITGTDVFSRVLRHRNRIMRNANTSIEDEEFFDCIRDMIAVLQDSQALKNRKESISAVQNLSQALHQGDVDLPQDWPNETVMKAEIKAYSMTKRCRGRCFILSNKTFPQWSPDSTRHGTEQDVEKLNKLFEKLHFKVIIHLNLTAQAMEDKLKEEARDNDQNQAECFICVICSHGTRDGIYGTDGKTISLERITEYFDGGHCPALQSKPKLFFIQACQGGTKDTPGEINVGDGGQDLSNLLKKECTLENLNQSDAKAKRDSDKPHPNTVPTKADMLIACATHPGYVSLRHVTYGSWFIQAVIHVFQKYAVKEDIYGLLTLVNRLVSRGRAKVDGTDPQVMQAPQFQTSLTKKFLFFPGLVSDP